MRTDVALSIALGMALMLSACSPTPKSSGGSSNPQGSPSGPTLNAGGSTPGESPRKGSTATSPPAAGSAINASTKSGGLSTPPSSASGPAPSANGGAQARLRSSATTSPPAAGGGINAPRSSGGSSTPPSSSSNPAPSANGGPQAQLPSNGSATTSPPAAGSPSTAMTGPSKGNEAEGKKLFVAKCLACHKADGSGGVKLTGNATPDWSNPNLMLLPAHSDSALRNCITNGRPTSGMVAWVKSGQLKPTQVEDLIAYIHTFSKKR